MSDIDMDEELGAENEGGRKGMSGKVLVLYIIAPLFALAAIGYGAYAFFGSGPGSTATGSDGSAQVEIVNPADAVFYEMPEFLVNLTSPSGGPTRYLKLQVSLQLPDKRAASQIESAMPLIIDGFQVYLRELRPEDFQGSASMFLLREELLRRVNLAARPVRVQDVLFREVIVQ